MSVLTKQTRVVIALGSAQTLARGSTYYLPAILTARMARELWHITNVLTLVLQPCRHRGRVLIHFMLADSASRRNPRP